ncbi:MAG: DinB family protein [Candidatus Thorarchaeota archaeon]
MEELISYLLYRRLGNLFVLKMIPAELWDWKPILAMRSVSELANHLACAPLCLFEVFRGTVTDESSYKDIEAKNFPGDAQGLVQVYERGLEKLIAYLRQHIDEAHEENIKGFYQQPYSSLYKEVLHHIGHEWFHLGQLFTYLRQNGVEIDAMVYYGYRDPDSGSPPNK